VNTDGSILVNVNGTMMVTDSEGKNPKIILRPGENPDVGYGDLSPDGKKLLYRKILDASYGWSDGVLAYYDIEAKKETIIPNISNGCGYPPKWAPNGFHIMYHEASCSRGWPGAILRITDINGSFQEYIVPASNDYPYPGIFSHDGSSILVGFAGSGAGGAAESMGGPANFYVMTLATPMPEFGSTAIMVITILAFITGLVLKQRFASFW
jgi:Tol biopolymer transport system component